MTTTSLILILNVTMLMVNAVVSTAQSMMIYREVKRNDEKAL